MLLRVGSNTLQTAFAWPSGSATEVLEATEGAMGTVRARIAAGAALPDPFHVRAALVAHPASVVEGCEGRALTRDAVDAVLVGQPGMLGVLAFQSLGPLARGVRPDPEWTWLRWRSRGPPVGPARTGPARRWSTTELGDDPAATVRCIAPLPRGRVAIGSDYGLTIGSASGFTPFPWPAGARRENRRVEAMYATRELLHVATQQAIFTWDYAGEPRARKHPADSDGGYDDVLALSASPTGMLTAWRTHMEGGRGPADCLCFATDPNGVVYAGTRGGEVHVVDGGGPIHAFSGEKVLREGPAGAIGRPVRHLAFADNRLWAAAAGGLHAFDGAAWVAEPGSEPVAMGADEGGRLWLVRDGAVWVRDRGELRAVDVGLERPWTLACLPGATWVGGVGAVAMVPMR